MNNVALTLCTVLALPPIALVAITIGAGLSGFAWLAASVALVLMAAQLWQRAPARVTLGDSRSRVKKTPTPRPP
jgi:hypothetical protein